MTAIDNMISIMYGSMVLNTVLFIVMIWSIKKTHVLQEIKGLLAGKPLVLFFTDYKTVEWKNIKPDAGVVQDKFYGSFIVAEEGSYTDRKTRLPLMCFNSETAMGAPVKMFAATDAISKVLKDKKMMGVLRQQMADGTLDGVEFSHFKESINFSSLKGIMNSLTPHSLTNLISKMVAKEMNSMGVKQGQSFVWYAILAFGVLALGGVVIYLVMGKGSNPVQVSVSAADVLKAVATNASNVIQG